MNLLPSGVNWDRLHTVAFVDYRAQEYVYDMLQATMAIPPNFFVRPGALIFMFNQADPADPQISIRVYYGEVARVFLPLVSQ